MRLRGLKVREQLEALDVVEVVELELPLLDALELDARPLSQQLDQHGFGHRRRPHRRRRHHRRRLRGAPRVQERRENREFPSLTLRDPSGVALESFPGFLLHSSKASLIDFLLHRWDPRGQTEIDRLLQRLGTKEALDEGKKRIEVESFLSFLEDGHLRVSSQSLFVERESVDWDERSSWVRVEGQEGLHYCEAIHSALVLSIERERDVAGNSMLMREWLVFDPNDSLVVHVSAAGCTRYPDYDAVPQTVWLRFDQFGVAQKDLPGLQMPRSDLWPHVLIRVPEVLPPPEDVVDAPPSLSPLFIVEPWRIPDARRYSQDLPLIEDPEQAAAIFARCNEGSFLPTNQPTGGLDLEMLSPILVGALPFPPQREAG